MKVVARQGTDGVVASECGDAIGSVRSANDVVTLGRNITGTNVNGYWQPGARAFVGLCSSCAVRSSYSNKRGDHR